MHQQYHFRRRGADMLIWDVHRLVALSREFPRVAVRLADLAELDEAYWFSDGETVPTCRAIADHARQIAEVDLSFPIILSADGRVMDGMHRVLRALLEGHEAIEAVRFERDPEPDFVNKKPSELPYD